MERLQMLRKERGLRQADIADYLGVAIITVSRYEAGEREPDNATLIKLADYFNVSTNYLLGKTDYRNEAAELERMAYLSSIMLSAAVVIGYDLAEQDKELENRFAELLIKFFYDKNFDGADRWTIYKAMYKELSNPPFK